MSTILTEEQIAEQIARGAHVGQKRWNGMPYIVHPARVVERVYHPNQRVVAWLHDVLEDTLVTPEHLIESGIQRVNVESVIALSHIPNEFYYDYIMRLSTNRLAVVVKIAVLTDNLSDLKDGPRRQKYLLARELLVRIQEQNKLKWALENQRL